MEKRNLSAERLFAALLMLPIVFTLAWGMGKRPPDSRTTLPEGKGQTTTGTSLKAQLAAMAGVSRTKIDLLETSMSGWEAAIYEEYATMMQQKGSDKKVLMYQENKKDIRVGLDSSFAVIVESSSYFITEEGRDDNSCIAGFFINGSLYAMDYRRKVLWRKEYDCGGEPMWGQGLHIIAFGDRHIVIQIPDSSKLDEEYNRTYILIDKAGKEKRKFDSDDFIELTEKGKYLILMRYDEMMKSYKQIVYNLYKNDSVVVYGAKINISEYNDMLYLSSVYFDDKGKRIVPARYIKYDDIKGKIIDMRPKP